MKQSTRTLGAKRRAAPGCTGLALALLLAGCVTPSLPIRQVGPEDAGLYAWLDQELAPYLINELSRQPRFRGEPVLLVSMNGADVRPDIDALTRNLRSRLFDRLLHAPGTGLLWRPSVDPWEHHRGNERLRCSTASTAHYFVGIDIAAESRGNYRVSVRALDVGAAAWVSGFGKTWQGRLTPKQRQALAERRTDEYLRGLRVLPFFAGETDLLAAYLAQNLSCLLHEQGATGLRVYVDTGAARKAKLRQVLTLIGHNLARYRAVEITEDISDAELLLKGSMNAIDGSLHQLWLQVRARSADANQTGLDTDAYIDLGRPEADPVAVGSPAPSTLIPHRSRRERAAVLSKLRVLAARAADGCSESSDRAPPAAVAPDECFLVEFDLHQAAHLLVLNHAVDGALTRLSQGGCSPLLGSDAWTVARRNLRIQRQGGIGFPWAGRPGVESIYAIAVTDPEAARELVRHAHVLPDDCAANPGERPPADRQGAWLAQLDSLIDRHASSVDWQAVRVRHAQP